MNVSMSLSRVTVARTALVGFAHAATAIVTVRSVSLISKRVNSYNQILIIIILYPVLVSGSQRDGTARRRRRDPQPRSREVATRTRCGPGRVSAWGASRFGFVFRVSGLGLSPLCRFESPFPLSNHTFGYSTVVRTVHVHAVGNSGWRPHRSEKDNMVGPKLMQTSQHLREHAALLAASSTHTQAPIAAWKVHDYCNLVTLPVVVVLTGLSLTSPRWARPLALYFLVYIAADAIWICAQPEIVRAPAVLLSHHAATALLLVHALTHAAHRKYVAWLSCVELNTFFIILRRHIRRPTWAVAIDQRSFAISWLLIRVCLFPVVVMVCGPYRPTIGPHRRIVSW